ncbi:hypothetical protein, partial [Phenylobacterium sp. SCN 70-31]|uniref:hypothetical protein n=1 Tax=Phenylobacterium sp. SCN 70-31 TaxID=1660129 RepID=UPI0025CEF480
FDNDGEDLWRFAGWNWSQDFWCEGDGTPVAFIELDAVTAPDPSADAWELVDKLTRALTGLTSGGSEFFVRCGERFVADTDSCLAYIKAARDGRLATLKAAIAAKQKAQAEADALRAENERLRAENAELAAANQRLGRLGRIVERERDELAARSVEGRDG